MKAGLLLWLLAIQPLWGASLLIPKLQRTAQSYALGDGAAVLSGLNALGVNPAGLSTPHPEFLTQYQPLLLDTNLGLLGFAYPWTSLQTTLGLSYLTVRSENFDKRDALGTPQGDFVTQDHLISLSLSRPFDLSLFIPETSRFFSDSNPLYLGTSLKLIRIEIDSYKASAFALDLGGRYGLSSLPISLGLSVLNIGKGPVLASQESKLPTTLVFSAAYSLNVPVTLLASLTRSLPERKNEFSLGMQYGIGQILALRGRYALTQGGISSSENGVQNLAAGFGLKLYRDSTLDYAFQPFDSGLQKAGAAGTHRFTFTFRLGGMPLVKKELFEVKKPIPMPYGYPEEKAGWTAQTISENPPKDLRDALREAEPKPALRGLGEEPQPESKDLPKEFKVLPGGAVVIW